jgi:hypothetical protein
MKIQGFTLIQDYCEALIDSNGRSIGIVLSRTKATELV